MFPRSCARRSVGGLVVGLVGLLWLASYAMATVPAHVSTWAYDDGCNGGAGAPAGLVGAWVTYAESHCGPAAAKAMSDCATGSCTPVAYLDPAWIYATGSAPVPWSEPERWWLHEPGVAPAAFSPANRVRSAAFGGGYLLNPASADVRRWLAGYVRAHYGRYPALMMDDTGGSLSALLYSTVDPRTGAPWTSTAEIGDDQTLQTAEAGRDAGLRRPDGTPFELIDNALSPNPYLSTPFGLLGGESATEGVIAEGSPIDAGTLTRWYPTLLDEIAYIDENPLSQGQFVVLLSRDPAGAVGARLVQEATILLGYRPGRIVDWADLETGSPDLAVWPEEGIVPDDPVQTMGFPGGTGCLDGAGDVCTTGGHVDLQPAGAPAGVFVREFRACYDRGVRFGTCAAIVNDTASAVAVPPAWLSQTYSWQIGFGVPAGTTGDVESGGTLNLTAAPFVPGFTVIDPASAMLLTGVSPPGAADGSFVGAPTGLVAGRPPWP